MDHGPTVVGGAKHNNNEGLVLDTTFLTGSNALGMWITITAGICSNLGVQLQKHAHQRQARAAQHVKENSSTSVYFVHKHWILGMVLVVIGSIGDFEALSFATQSLVATVGGGTTVLTNVFFSTIWHGETFTLRDAYGTCCILLGVTLIALCSPEDEQYNVEQLVVKFQRPSVLAYLAFVAAAIYFMHSIIRSGDVHAAIPTSLGTSARVRRFLHMDQASGQVCVQPLLYAINSGIMGSLSMLLGKCASEMVTTTLHGRNQFNHPLPFIFFAGMAATIGVQVHWFNQSLMLGDMAMVFPVFQVFWIGFGAVGGMVLYGDVARLAFFQSVSFVLAFWCILIGVYNLAQHAAPPAMPVAHTPGDSFRPLRDASPYLVDAYQTLLENDDGRHGDSATAAHDRPSTYRPPALLRTL
ncbi:hypothetical protein H310_07436 [Aphanomyces invadans]|uniref:Uncharacterized protein n=1 Tax=Aphanomyces invadans TaxID=157072 RepID=A0A024U319_9STRA|nr:hypothetical protein H310_07436 [Aphanomyces invadans]ETV99987.1 hypothetical protein H310_07436 [Aphanomyces invadans]|eukprot:XP_008871405.1 hypothetical protein H310_07436 [Aphanomyces invadans]